MDFIEVSNHDTLAEMLKEPLDFGSMVVYHWDTNVLSEARGYHRRSEKTCIKNNICFTIGDDYIELLNSVIEEEPVVQILPDIGGEARTLGMLCKFKIPNALIKGKISILNISSSVTTSDYELRLKDVDITTYIGFYIGGDSYVDDYFKHEFQKAKLSLTYKNESKIISLFDKVTDSQMKNLLECHILDKSTKEILEAIQEVFLRPIHDRGSVSESVGNCYTLRNAFRHHEKYLKAAFNIFADKIIEITNQLIKEKEPIITLAKLFEILTNKEEKKSINIYKGSVKILSTLERVKTPIILLENDLVIIYIPVDFSNIQIKYEKGKETKQENFKTIGSHLKLSIKKVDTTKAEINLLNFKINEFKSTSQSHFILDYLEFSLIEEKLKEYLTATLKSETINTLALHPPNVEITYDSDGDIGEDSEEENSED